MNRFWIYTALALGIFALGLGMGLGINGHRASKKAEQAQSQADQAVGQAQAHAAQAAASDRQADHERQTVSDADAHTATARREFDRLTRALPRKTPAPIEPAASAPDVAELEATRAALAQAQQVIADQQAQVEARDKLIASITASRDQWKATAEADERALALQKIASDAAVHSEHAHGVRAQLVRGLEGLAVGYVAGRVQR